MKISSFVIGFLVIAMFTVAMSFYISGIKQSYDTFTFNESEISSFNRVEEIQNLSVELNESLQQVEQGSAIDLIGGLITSGFTVMKTTWSSFGIYTDVMSAATDKVPLGQSTVSFKSIALMIGILLFIFAMVAILLGREV